MYAALSQFGLSENEILAYTTALKTGRSTANRIASVSGIKRSTTYDTLESLIGKGLMSISSQNGVQYYAAASPKRLLELLDEKRNEIKQLIPQLEKIRESKAEKSSVVLFEGKKGVLAVLNGILEEGKDFLFVGSRKMAKKPLKYFPDNFAKRRVQKRIFASGILAEEDLKDEFISVLGAKEFSSFSYRKELNGSLSDVFVYGDTVSFITNLEDPVGVIIHNKEIAKQMKLLLSLIESS